MDDPHGLLVAVGVMGIGAAALAILMLCARLVKRLRSRRNGSKIDTDN